MKLGLGLTVLAAAFALTACGGGNGAKLTTSQQAAQAVFGAGNAPSGQQALLSNLAARATASGSATVSCPKGGEVTLSGDASSNTSTTSATLKIDFNGCVTGTYTDPKTQKTGNVTTDGSLTYTFDSTASSVAFTINGHLDFSGAIDDSVDVTNVAYEITSTTTGTTTSVGLTLTGDIKTGSGHSFHYDGTQSYTFDGTISANP